MVSSGPALVTLYYKGCPYYAKDVRYWLKSRVDGFVYESSDDPATLEANDFVGVWDRVEGQWHEHRAEQTGGEVDD